MATGNAKQKLSCLKWEAVKASKYIGSILVWELLYIKYWDTLRQ